MIKTVIKILLIAIISLNITNTSAEYKYKIEDRIKINSVDEKIKKYISDKKNSYFLAKRLKNKIEKILGKSEKEIIEKYNNKKSKYKDFKEFALTDIYSKIKIINNSVRKNIVEYGYYNYGKATILKNDYIKIIVSDTGFTLNNNKLFWTRKDGSIFNYIEFFKINSKEETKNYIMNNFIEKKYKGLCELVQFKNRFEQLESYYFGLLKKYQSKEVYPGSAICPSEFTKGYSNNGINYFQRISPNTLIYINAGQDFVGIDFGSMEIK